MVAVLGPAYTYVVPARSRPHKGWTVGFLMSDGRAFCACPATRECRHIKSARKVHERLMARHEVAS